MKTRKLLSILLAFMMIFSSFPTAVFAEEEPESQDEITITTEVQEVTPDEKGSKSPDELFADYVEASFWGESEVPSGAKGAIQAGDSLTGMDRAIYDSIAAQLPLIAAGERDSTSFVIPVEDFGLEQTSWTAAELGIEAIFEGGKISAAAKAAVQAIASFDLDSIIKALLADHPYQLYWYDKTSSTGGTGYGMSAGYDSERGDYVISLEGNLTLNFPVAAEYAADTGTFVVDTTIGQTVQTSVANANAIVDQYSGQSNLAKLTGYKNAICDLVSYNNAAAGGGMAYGNPWQLIWVFDGDLDTNVVCEGYSKAFKYLCDQSEFSDDVSCIIVSGTMDGGSGAGGHMWNIVRREDGKNVLVDVTNCDTGTIGAPDQLFMTGYDSQPSAGNYVFDCTYGSITYEYYPEMYSIFSEDTLSIASRDELAASEHVWDCIWAWTPNGDDDFNVTLTYTCSHCDATYVFNAGLARQEESPLTCTQNGIYIYTAFVNPDRTPDGVERVDQKTVTITAPGHTVVIDPAVEPTYTEPGLTQGSHCSVCGLTLEEQEVIPALGGDVLTSGTIANRITWTVYQNGGLVITGIGALPNYNGNAPWSEYEDMINYVGVEEGITRIGSQCFKDITHLNVVRLPESLTMLGTEAFRGCTDLSDIYIPDSITSYPDGLFRDCSTLAVLTVGDNVSQIGANAFNGCTSLASITIPTGMMTIQENAFLNCSSLAEVYYDASPYDWDQIEISETGNDALASAHKNFTGTLVGKGETGYIVWSFYTDGSLTFTLREGEESEYLSTILNNELYTPWLQYKDNILSIEIGEGIYGIGENAFDGCSNLTSVELPESLREIGSYDFRGCTQLASVEFHEGLTFIGEGAFYGCSALTGIVFPDSLQDIQPSAFALCSSLTDIVIPKNVDFIYPHSFESCTSLESVTLPLDLWGIYEYAFNGCTSLTDVYFDGPLHKWSSLTKEQGNDVLSTAEIHVTNWTFGGFEWRPIPNGSGYNVWVSFTHPTNGETRSINVSVRSSITTAPDYGVPGVLTYTASLYYSQSLDDAAHQDTKTETIPALDSVSGTFGDGLSWVLDSEGVLTISGNSAIPDYTETDPAPWAAYSEYIISVVIEDGVTGIGTCAFSGCENMTELSLPHSVTVIGAQAFDGCDGLSDVYYEGSQEEWEELISASGNESLSSADVHLGLGFTIEFKDPNGNLLWSNNFYSGTQPVYGGKRIIQIDEDYYYITGWEPEIVPATEDAVYTAVLEEIEIGYAWTETENGYDVTATASKGENGYPVSQTVTAVVMEKKEAGCETAGWTRYEAVFDTVPFETQERTDDIPATGHTEAVLPAVAPTCTETGLTAGTKCSVCGEILVEQEIIPALGHEEEDIPGYAATCTATGLTTGTKCSVCGEILVEQEIIPAPGHEEEIIPGRAATCTEAGLTEGSKCSVCGEILTEQTEIPALGHEWLFDEMSWIETEDGMSANALYYCHRCEETESAAAEVTSEVVTPATCSAEGQKTYTAHIEGSSSLDGAVHEGEKIVPIEKLPHTEEIIPGTEPTETSTGLTEGKKCSVCGEILEEQQVIPALVNVRSVEYDPSIVIVGEATTITVITSANAQYLRMYTTAGTAVTTWTASTTNSVVSGNDRIWTVSRSFTGSGNRAFTFKASNDNKTYGEGKTATLQILSAPIVSSVEYNPSIVIVGEETTITVKTTAGAQYLRMFTSAGTAVTTWTATAENSVVSGNERIWTVTKSFTGAGTRAFTFKASRDNKTYGEGKAATLQILSAPVVTSVEYDPETVVVGEATTITVKTTAGAQYLRMYTSAGTAVTTWTASANNSVVSGNERIWTVSKSFTGAGTREFTFKASRDNKTYGDGKSATLHILPPAVTSVKYNPSTVVIGEATTITVKTTAAAQYLRMFTSAGTAVTTWTATADNSVVRGNERIWTVSRSFSGSGSRAFTFKASIDNKTYGEGKTATLQILSAPVVASVVYNPSIVIVGEATTITVKTTAGAQYLRMFTSAGTAVTTWTATADNSVVRGNERIWTVSRSFSGSGTRAFTFKASRDNKTYGDGKTATLQILSAPVVTSVEYDPATVIVGEATTITVKTTAGAQYLRMFTSTGTIVTTWTATAQNSTVSGNERIWTVTKSFSGAGTREFTFKASRDNKTYGDGKSATLKIVKQ